MDAQKLEYYKSRLLSEKEGLNGTLNLMKKNETIESNAELASELSFYDNHPGDLGEEISDIEKGRALKENEMGIINKIDDALKAIDLGTFGVCKVCGGQISEERLEFIPYATYCVNCQKNINHKKPKLLMEETVVGRPFGFGFNDDKDDVGFDAEDSYQAVARYNNIEDSTDYFEDDEEGYVEPIEKISNEQYKSQLPD